MSGMMENVSFVGHHKANTAAKNEMAWKLMLETHHYHPNTPLIIPT